MPIEFPQIFCFEFWYYPVGFGGKQEVLQLSSSNYDLFSHSDRLWFRHKSKKFAIEIHYGYGGNIVRVYKLKIDEALKSVIIGRLTPRRGRPCKSEIDHFEIERTLSNWGVEL